MLEKAYGEFILSKKNEFLQKDHRSTTVFTGFGPMRLFLFPKLKLPLRGTRFDSIEAVKENSQRELKAIPDSAYKACFDDWKKRWHMCIASEGAYFEGDKINIDED